MQQQQGKPYRYEELKCGRAATGYSYIPYRVPYVHYCTCIQDLREMRLVLCAWALESRSAVLGDSAN
jgi:hypothetical protein